MSTRLLHILIALDQLAFCLVTLGRSHPDETASAAAWRLEVDGRWQGRVFRPLIDALFWLIEREHCRRAFLSEMQRLQLPAEYRSTITGL